MAIQSTTLRSLQPTLDRIAKHAAAETERGRVADYIPELACVDSGQFGIAVAPLDGEPLVAGDGDTRFSIQSISKVFSLVCALRELGGDVWKRVGREPSGDPFNSIVQLEYEHGVPRNPFINAGALVVADILTEKLTAESAVQTVLDLCRAWAGDESITLDQRVAASEKQTGARNRALAHFMCAEGNLRCKVEDVLDVYFRHCSIAMSCRQLALAGRALASGCVSSVEAHGLTMERSRRIGALMMTCGAYDASGEFAFRIGIPTKTGVGGGILGVVPGVAGIAAWSPGLDAKGNSTLACSALEELVREAGWSVFGAR